MKSTGIPQVTALLAALALTLPACTQDTESNDSTSESVASESAELAQAGGKDRHQGKLEGMKQRFAEADSNGDGKLTLQEHQAALAKRFASIDADHDGQLSEAELQAMHKAHEGKRLAKGDQSRRGAGKRFGNAERQGAGKRFAAGERDADGKGPGKMRGPKHMDADGNGTVSLEEFSKRQLDWFERADADGDGAVTLAEIEAAAKAKKGMRGKGGKHHGARRGHERLQKADANGDGQITKAEVQAQRSAEFDELDADGNGMLSPEERPAKGGKAGKRGPGPEGEQRAHKGFGPMDQDEDGQLSKAEFLAGIDRMFERLDTDSDDVISAEELAARTKMGRKGRPGSAKVGQ